MPMLPPGAVPLTPEELQSLTPLDPALPAGAQRVDPFTEFDEATLLEKLRSSELSHAELKRYAAENLPPSHNADEQQFATRLKLARVSEAYKDTDFTPADFAKMAAGTFSALWETGKALGQTVPKVAAVTPGALAAKAIGRTAADALPLPESVKQQMGVGKPVIEEALQSGGEIFAGVESEGTMLLQMAERAASKVMRSRAAQGIMSLLPVGGSVAATAGRTAGLAPSFAKMTNGQILAEFDEDIEAEQDLAQTMQGGGALTQALYGPDTATGSLLANAGMELRPEEIETVMKAGLVGLPAFAGAGAAAKGALGAAGRAAYKAVPFVAAESAAAKAGQLALDAAKKALANPASAELAEAAKVAAQVHKSALEVAANAAGKAPVIAARAGVEKLAQAGSVAGEKLAEGLTKGAGWAARGAVRGAQAVLGTTEWLGKMGPLIGFGAGAVKAGPWGAMAGGLAGERIAQSIGRILEPMRKVTARLDQSGRNLVAGTPAKAGPYGRLAFDVANATPQFLAQVGLGALDDVFFAMATSETPEELQNQPMFGTFLRAVPAAGRVAGRVTGGQESHPRNWWKNASTSNKTEYGVFPGLDAMHTDLVGKADAGVSARIGAIRAMTESRGGQVFLADPARAQAFLEQHGYTPEEAAHAVKQRGMSLFNVPDATGKPHRIAFAFTPDAAPHEAKHLFQAAQGEVANRLVNKIIKADYGNRWDEIGQDYVSRLLPEAARKEAAALGLTWQEAWVRHADNIGPKESITEAYANERADDLLGSEIAADIYDGLVEHGGPELLVSQGLPGKLARILSGVLQAFGQEPWEGAPVLKEAFDPAGIQIPLKARSAEAVRKAALGTPEAPVAAPDLLTPPSATAPRVEPAAPTPPPLPTAPRVDPTTLSGAELTQARADAHQRAQDAAKELLTPLPKDLTGDARVAKQNEIQQRFEQAKKDGEDLWREQLSRQAKATPTPAPAPAPKAPVVKPAATPGKAEQLPLDFTAPAPKVEPAAPVAPKAAPTPAAPKVEPATPTPSARLDSPEAVEKVIRDNPDTRTFQIEHAQVERATDATREQERLAQEVGRELPDDVRQKVEKIFTVRNGSDGQPRFEDTGKGKMVVGIAPIQRLVNAKRVVQMAHAANRNDLIPYPTNGKGSLTSDAWRSLHADMERVQWNHEHGWRGDGTGPIKVPEGIDAFVPPDTMPKDGQLEVPQMKADFINLLNGASIAPPKSLRAAPKGQKQHANVRAAGIAKASQRGNEPARTGALPGESGGYFGDDLMAAIKGESQPRQETNPLRKRMAEEGLPIYTVPDVESRIHLKHITRAEPRTDIRNDAVSSDVTRAGFSPARDLGFSAKEEAAIDRASRYFEIGHGPALDREGTDAGTYSKDRMWLYNPEQRQLLTGDTDGTHEGRWSGTDRAYKGRYDDAQKKVSVMFPDRERERIEAEGREPSVDDIPAGVYNSLQRQFGKKAKIIAFSPGRKTKSAGDLLVKEIKRDEPDYWETEISEWLPLGRDGESIRLELVTSGIGDHPVAKSAYTKETGSTDTSVQWDKEYAGWARKRAAEVIYGEEKVKAAIAKDPTFFQAEPSEASLKALGQSTTSGFVYKPAPEAGYTPPDLPTTRASDVDQSAWLMPDGKAYLVKNSAAGGYHDAHVYGFADFDTTPVAGKQGDAVVAEFQRQTGGVRLAVLSSNRRLYDGGGDLGISTSYKPTEAQLSFLKSRMLAELNPGTPSFRTIAVDVTGPDGNVVMGKVFSGPNHKMLVGEVMRYLRDPLKAAAEQPKFSPARADDNRVVLGMANRDGTEFAGMRISNRTPQGRFPQHRELFPQNNDVDYKFRYLPGEDTVYWWERPSREVMDDVAARLEDRGLGSPSRHAMIDLTQEGNADRRYNRLFSPARAAGAPKGKEAEAAKLWEIESTASPYFRRWFGNSKVVDADGQPKVVYHGRLSQFEAFDNAKTNPESDVGPAHYFSDERVDSEANYASLYGPDWKVKLEARADELVFDAPEEIRGDMDAQYAWAKKKAIEELVGTEQPEGNVIETYLKIEKPVVVSDDPKTSTRWDMTDKTGLALWNAVLKASRKLGLQGTRVWDGVTAPLHRPNRTKGRDDFGIGLENGEDVTAQQLLNRLAHTDDVYDVDGGPGRVFQEIMRELGHDGVIIESAGTRYAGMEYTDGATHYAVFEPEQVKSSDNRGTFNPKDPRFRFSPEREQNRVPRRGFGGVRAARDTGGPVKPAIEWPEEVTDADRKASLKEFQAKRKQATPAGDAGLQMDKSGADGFSKAWILPDGTPQLLGGKWHHEWVQENADQFGLTERDSKPGDEGLREALVRKGGVRVNLSSSGAFTIEARKADWNRQKDAVRDLIEANLSRIGTLQVHLLNDKASRAVDADSVALFNMRSAPEKLAAIPFIDGVDKVDAGAAAAVEGRDPSPYRQAQAFPDAPVFSPRRLTHVDLPTELEKARKGEIEGQSFNPDGSIWNPRNRRVDMVTLASVNLPQSQLTKESVLRALGKNSELLGQKGIVLGFGKLGSKRLRNPEGVYEPAWSVDLNSAVPQSLRENTVAFAKANGQREIWDAKTGEAIPTGGSGDTVLSDPRDLLKAHSLLQNGEAAEVSDIPILREREELVSGDQGGFGFMAELEVRDPRHPNNMTRSEVSKAYPEVYLPPNRAQKVDIAGFDESPLYKAAKNEAEAVKQLGEKLVAEYKAKESIPEVQDGAKWYSRFVPLLKKHFGEHSGLMAELLAATSPRNNPTVNFDYAVQALWKYQDGHYDSLIEKYLEGVRGLEDGSTQAIYEADLAAGQVANPAATPGPATYMGHLIEKYNLKPTKANDKLFGATSDAVMQVLARTWLTHNRGPKVSNFVQNLLGVGHRATVDVWAGRTIRRMSHEGYVDKWRVLPANDAGISDRNFDLGQQAFDYAANKLGIEADALQGALWFAEKKHWADKGWQRLNLGDYATELKKLPELRRKYEGGEDPARPNLGLTIVPR